MKSLPAEPLAAQKQGRVKPAVRLMVRDREGADLRLNWQALYSATEPDGPNACVQAADGSLVRACADPATNKLWIQRVTDPMQGSQWTAWTDSVDTAYDGQMALAVQPSGPKVWLFFGATSGNVLYVRESQDYGDRWWGYAEPDRGSGGEPGERHPARSGTGGGVSCREGLAAFI